MGTYPRDRQQFLLWCEAHFPVWESAPAAIGLTAAQTAAFKTATNTMRARVNAQKAAQDAAKAATESAGQQERVLRENAGDLVRSIRAFAENSNNPNVYVQAQIPAPQPASPVPPPGQPENFRVELNPGGSITIRWKARHPQGSDRVVYFVRRKLPGQTAFTLLGGTGEKAFTDETLPAGAASATYIVQAQRGNISGPPSQQLTISFGVGGPGLTIASVTEGPTRLAA
jgi:uncharacterized cupredoxin-like copper-binding protein